MPPHLGTFAAENEVAEANTFLTQPHTRSPGFEHAS